MAIVVVLIALGMCRRCWRVRTRPPLRCKRIGLPDQAGKFGQWIAALCPPMLIATAIVIGRKRSVLISFGHRDDASLRESRAPLDQGHGFRPTRLSTKSKRSGFCRLPPKSLK